MKSSGVRKITRTQSTWCMYHVSHIHNYYNDIQYTLFTAYSFGMETRDREIERQIKREKATKRLNLIF